MTEHSVDYGALRRKTTAQTSPHLALDDDCINAMLADAQGESSGNQEESRRAEVDRESGSATEAPAADQMVEAIPNQPDPVVSPKRARRRKPDFKSLRDAWDAALHPESVSQTHSELEAALRPPKPEPFAPENFNFRCVKRLPRLADKLSSN